MSKSLSRKNLWGAAPQAVREAVGRGLGVLPPTWLLGPRFRRTSAFLRDAQWWTADRAAEYQLGRMQRICEIAARGSAYYRQVFADAGFRPGDLTSLDAVRQLPTISRETVRAHLDDMRVRPSWSLRVDAVSTGGTGGVPLHFYIGADRSAIEYAYLCSGWRRAGFEVGLALAVFRGRPVQPNRQGLRHHYDGLLRHHHYSVFHMGDESLGRYLSHVESIGPCYLHAYPSTAEALARYVRRSGRQPLDNVRGILLESEIAYPSQRALIEEVFGRRCFSSYGQTEKVVAAAGCEHSALYHVWPTYGYFELLDELGRPVSTPGQRGEIVGTSFINEIVPFIRYRTGDFATFHANRCAACGREHPIIEQISGHRKQEYLVASDGTRISWTAVNMHDDTFVHARQFQFFQETPGRAVLRVVPGTGYTAIDGERIRRRLLSKLEGQVDIAVERVDAIRLSPVGKAIFVEQRVEDPGQRDEDQDSRREPVTPLRD